MDSGAWALIGVAVLGLIGTIYTVVGSRKSSSDQARVGSDANTISEFEANIRAFDLRARNAEDRAKELSDRMDALEVKDQERERQLRRTLLIVQKWFRDLSAAWPADVPMPLPSDDDLDVLGITLPKNRKKEV